MSSGKWIPRSIKRGIMSLMSERFYNVFFYNYMRVKQGRRPRWPDLKNPKTFNEKTIWLKLAHAFEDASLLADKVRVKDHVKNLIGSDYLIPTLGVYDRAGDIEYDALPDAFVMKLNHGSGWNIICRDRDRLDTEATNRKLTDWQRLNYYDVGKEYQYRDIPPRILCESYLENTSERPLLDYKFFCFSGNPVIIQVDLDRFGGHRRKYYDPDWNELPFTILYPMSDRAVARPEKLDEMLKIAAKLCDDYVFVRVDLYYHEGRIYFGELTFHHDGGFGPFTPSKYDRVLGEMITLPGHQHKAGNSSGEQS